MRSLSALVLAPDLHSSAQVTIGIESRYSSSATPAAGGSGKTNPILTTASHFKCLQNNALHTNVKTMQRKPRKTKPDRTQFLPPSQRPARFAFGISLVRICLRISIFVFRISRLIAAVAAGSLEQYTLSAIYVNGYGLTL
jgi:hypothetical protein